MLAMVPIAFRNVLRNRRRTLITLLALLIGVGVMVSMQGLLNSLQRALVDNIVGGQTGALQVHRTGYLRNVLSSPLSLNFDVAAVSKIVERDPEVTAAAP